MYKDCVDRESVVSDSGNKGEVNHYEMNENAVWYATEQWTYHVEGAGLRITEILPRKRVTTTQK